MRNILITKFLTNRTIALYISVEEMYRFSRRGAGGSAGSGT